MNALDVLYNIINNDTFCNYNFKYCLVDKNKLPYKLDKTLAKPNVKEDFVDLYDIANNFDVLKNYQGLGISIQASNVSAIDIDQCVENAFDINTINEVATSIIYQFKDNAYIEFSFSGHGIRILFKAKSIQDYVNKYYIKNSKQHIEYYYPEGSNRYVTITGKYIYNNNIQDIPEVILFNFLNTFMLKNIIINKSIKSLTEDKRSISELMNIVKKLYFKDYIFQDLWFKTAPGSGKDESERDYHLIVYLYECVTQDKEKIKELFESSPFFKSKDFKHMKKWTQSNYRYFNYLYDRISNR